MSMSKESATAVLNKKILTLKGEVFDLLETEDVIQKSHNVLIATIKKAMEDATKGYKVKLEESKKKLEQITQAKMNKIAELDTARKVK